MIIHILNHSLFQECTTHYRAKNGQHDRWRNMGDVAAVALPQTGGALLLCGIGPVATGSATGLPPFVGTYIVHLHLLCGLENQGRQAFLFSLRLTARSIRGRWRWMAAVAWINDPHGLSLRRVTRYTSIMGPRLRFPSVQGEAGRTLTCCRTSNAEHRQSLAKNSHEIQCLHMLHFVLKCTSSGKKNYV